MTSGPCQDACSEDTAPSEAPRVSPGASCSGTLSKLMPHLALCSEYAPAVASSGIFTGSDHVDRLTYMTKLGAEILSYLHIPPNI